MLKPLLPLAFTASILLTACGGSSSSAPTAVTPSDNQSPKVEAVTGKNLGMNLDLSKLKSSGIAADKVVVKITKGDFTRTIETTHTDYAASVEFSGLTVGEYAISVQIFDGETLVAEGSGTGAVSANKTATVNMDLELKSGGLIVNINVPEPVEGKEFLSIEKTVTTTTEKLEGGPITPFGHVGGIIADRFTHAIYENEASFGKLDKGANIKINFGFSYDNLASNAIKAAESVRNTLTLMHNENTLLSCTACDVDVESNGSILSISYPKVDLPEEVFKSIIDTRDGVNIFGKSGFPMKHQGNVLITLKKTDGSSISINDINAESQLDDNKYQIVLSVEGINSLAFTGFLSGGYSYGTLSASSAVQ